ncbi:MAG: aldo/keto reductase [Burkholderiales bacterium]|nr:aldo/keto reductase [Burkholderiales bacterium]
MNTICLPQGETLPSIGLGTWRMGESSGSRRAELAAIRLAVEIGYRVFDTAEMYGEGRAEQVLGQALGDALRAHAVQREELFVVSKVYPHNASRTGTVEACERSLQRLALDQIDLYLLHWPGSFALSETVAGFEALQSAGRIRHWGVSNFDLEAMRSLVATPGGERCASNQVYYSLTERGPEFDLLPWQRERAMPVMAYSPVDQGVLSHDRGLARLGERVGATASQLALARLMAEPGVMVIPKAVREAHLRENFASGERVLTPDDITEIDRLFPSPRRKSALAMR